MAELKHYLITGGFFFFSLVGCNTITEIRERRDSGKAILKKLEKHNSFRVHNFAIDANMANFRNFIFTINAYDKKDNFCAKRSAIDSKFVEVFSETLKLKEPEPDDDAKKWLTDFENSGCIVKAFIGELRDEIELNKRLYDVGETELFLKANNIQRYLKRIREKNKKNNFVYNTWEDICER